MANTWFQFKNFTIHQEKAAMKVCTDASLFAAWVASKVENESSNIRKVLDIGTGTGLLSLMLAQKLDAKMAAVEIDEAAARQANENFQLSPYNERLQLIRGDIRNAEGMEEYDLIISNPPFFENDLKSENLPRNVALHSNELSFEELIRSSQKLLRKDGIFFVLLPFNRTDSFIKLARDQSLFVQEQVFVKQTEKHGYFRSMLRLTKSQNEAKTAEIIIKTEGTYSGEFIGLLKDYYLFL